MRYIFGSVSWDTISRVLLDPSSIMQRIFDINSSNPVSQTSLLEHYFNCQCCVFCWTEKNYESEEEEMLRKAIFTQHLKTINMHNYLYSNGLKSYTMGVNKYTDLVRSCSVSSKSKWLNHLLLAGTLPYLVVGYVLHVNLLLCDDEGVVKCFITVLPKLWVTTHKWATKKLCQMGRHSCLEIFIFFFIYLQIL